MNLVLNVKRKLALLLVCLLTLCLPQTAFATETTGAITLCYAVSDAEFQLYQVGQMDSENGIALSGEFAGYGVELESETAAATLAAYVVRDHLAPLETGVTGDDCNVLFSQLERGVYLILGEPITVDGVLYTPSPVILSVPQLEGEGEVWDVTVNAKYEQEELPELIELSVLKIWENDSDRERPEEITVQLLRDGTVYDTMTLNSQNNWSYHWTELDGAAVWTVLEESVPDGYKVSVQRSGNAYIITNTGELSETPGTPITPAMPGTPTTPETPVTPVTPGSTDQSLPQTGQLWWPVSILACAGVGLVLIGLIRRKKSEQ